MKTLDTLPDDINQLFFEGKVPNAENLKSFLTGLGDLLTNRLSPRPTERPTMRMSKLGISDRKLWFEHNQPLPRTKSDTALKFVYGDIIEQLILFLAKECGHTVEDEQKEFEIDGIKGHQDCKLDGVVVDVKSASSYAFRKFSERTLFKDDPFGYVAQLSSYAHANNHADAAFIGVNKETGGVCILPLEPVDQIDPVQRIKRVKEVVAMPSPPTKKCYEPISYKTSANTTLNKNCTYCPYADQCWKDANGGKGLRYFNYSTGPVPMVEVIDTPRVDEIFKASAVGETETDPLGGDI